MKTKTSTRVVSDKKPPQVNNDNFDEFLATDDLFVEYFNHFLALPVSSYLKSFPEPLFFNIENKVFEIRSDAKKELAQRLRTEIVSRRPIPNIYHVVRQNAFSDIPIIPILPVRSHGTGEIDTSICITTLNSKQAIHWVKENRLSYFLKSDCYFEYRLAYLISRVRLSNIQVHSNAATIDVKSKETQYDKNKTKEETYPGESNMKNVDMCIDNVMLLDREAWFSHVISTNQTEPSYVCSLKSVNASRLIRPVSAMSSTSCHYEAKVHHDPSSKKIRPKSGVNPIASPRKSSVFSNLYSKSMQCHDPSKGDDMLQKPCTPRPGDPVCSTGLHTDDVFTSLVYAQKMTEKVDCDTSMAEGSDFDDGLETENFINNVDFEIATSSGKATDVNYERAASSDESADVNGEPNLNSITALENNVKLITLLVDSLDDMCAIIVGAVVKKAVSMTTGIDEDQLNQDPRIASLFPRLQYTWVCADMLDNVVAVIGEGNTVGTGVLTTAGLTSVKTIDNTQSVAVTMMKHCNQTLDHRSDVESLFDSEDDINDEGQQFIAHCSRMHSYDLSSRKGIQLFRDFLRNTAGQNVWSLWMDISRLLALPSREDQDRFLKGMLQKYLTCGGLCQLSHQTKRTLDLIEPHHWALAHLQSVHTCVVDQLLSYWVLRFLLRQLMKLNPVHYREYQVDNINLMAPSEVLPSSTKPTVFPLRPMSCQPRLHHRHLMIKDMSTFCDMLEQMWTEESENEIHRLTSPLVGNKRVHGPSAITLPVSAKQADMAKSKLYSPKQRDPQLPATPYLDAQARDLKQNGLVPSRTCRAINIIPERMRPRSSKPSSLAVMSRSHRPKNPQPATSLFLDDQLYKQRADMCEMSGKKVSITSQRASSLSGSDNSIFQGGHRMESLLQALYHENETGHFFKKFMMKASNMTWLHAAHFWHAVQEYRLLFYQHTFDRYSVRMHAQAIYSMYVVTGAPRCIKVQLHVRHDIAKHFDCPQEELFDEAEEESLDILYSAWIVCLQLDSQSYNKIELIQTKRHLEIRRKYLIELQKKGLVKEHHSQFDTVREDLELACSPVSLSTVLPQFKEYNTLERFICNRSELDRFRRFLDTQDAGIDLRCWMDIEVLRKTSSDEERKRNQAAKDIKMAYLNNKYFFGSNSPASKDGQHKIMQSAGGWGKMLDDQLPNAVLLEVQRYVRARLENKWLPLYLAAEECSLRQKRKTNVGEVADDSGVQKRRRSQTVRNVKQVLDSRWISSSEEILEFRKALISPVASHQFRRYVSLKGDYLENDVIFWQEVYKYKQMHHVHTEDSLLSQKAFAIINCFLDSQVPPVVQVNLQPDIVSRILDRKHERTPYLFREAQLAVFHVLFTHWGDFCQFKRTVSEKKVIPELERLHRLVKAKEKSLQREKAGEMIATQAKHTSQHESIADFGSQIREGRVSGNNGKLDFSYFNYMKELCREKLLNNIDGNVFSSMSNLSGGQHGVTSHNAIYSFLGDSVTSVDGFDSNNANMGINVDE